MLKSTQYIVVCTHNARVENDDRIEKKTMRLDTDNT